MAQRVALQLIVNNDGTMKQEGTLEGPVYVEVFQPLYTAGYLCAWAEGYPYVSSWKIMSAGRDALRIA